MPDILNLIQTLGFPTAVCIFLAYYIKTQNDKYREDVEKLNTQYREDVQRITEKYEVAIKDFQESLDKNTQVLTRLDARLDKSTEKVD